jgi:hypothetical protein
MLQAVGPHLDLLFAFFTTDIKGNTSFQLQTHLQKQALIYQCLVRRLPAQCFPDNAATQHTVQFCIGGIHAVCSFVSTSAGRSFLWCRLHYHYKIPIVTSFSLCLFESVLQQTYSIAGTPDIYLPTLHFHNHSSDRNKLF